MTRLDEINEAAGKRIRTVLKQALATGWSQRGLSLAAGLSDTAVRDLFRRGARAPSFGAVEALANALGGTVDEIFGEGERIIPVVGSEPGERATIIAWLRALDETLESSGAIPLIADHIERGHHLTWAAKRPKDAQ